MTILNVYGWKFFKKNANLLVGIIYRHPHEGIQWNKLFESQFNKVLECEKEIYLIGDFLKITWLEYMESFGLKQIIESPTRVTDNSKTLIDHRYCNTPNNIISADVPT